MAGGAGHRPGAVPNPSRIAGFFKPKFRYQRRRLLAGRLRLPRLKALMGGLLCVVVVAQVGVELRYGTWTTAARPTRTLRQMDAQKRHSLAFRGVPGYGMQYPIVDRQMEHSALEPRLARFYRRCVVVSSPQEAYRAILWRRTPSTIVVENGPAPARGRIDPQAAADEVTLTYSSFNRLVFAVSDGAGGYLSVAFPGDGRWRALVDGCEAPVFRANGYENAVLLPAGDHTVAFRYVSRATLLGVAVSLATRFALLSVFWARMAESTFRRRLGIALAAVACAALWGVWHAGLYSGRNLHTEYRWSTRDFPREDDLAYARPTRMFSIWSDQMPYFYYAGLAVDGCRDGRPFTTGRGDRRLWWQVDLGHERMLGEVVITDRGRGRNCLPLAVYTSPTAVPSGC